MPQSSTPKRCPECGHKFNPALHYCPECESYCESTKLKDIKDKYEDDVDNRNRKLKRKKKASYSPL